MLENQLGQHLLVDIGGADCTALDDLDFVRDPD